MNAPDLPSRLRRQTSGLSNRTVIAVGFPGSIRTLDDYVAVLERLRAFHLGAEGSLENPDWPERWEDFGIDLADHRRSSLIAEDLIALGHHPKDHHAAVEPAADFGHALGSLWVIEGSALGGRAMSPTIQAAVGVVPTRFFDDYGNDRPRPRRSSQDALRQFAEGGGDTDSVMSGAQNMYAAYARHLTSTLWSGTTLDAA